MKIRILIVLFLLLSMGACAPREQVKPQPEQPAQTEELKLPDVQLPPAKEQAPKEEAKTGEKKPAEQYVMLNFDNADLETVITTVGEMLKINYMLAPGVSGKITVQSHNKIPLSELFSTFQSILEFNGFTAVKYGSFYRIVPIDTAKQQPIPIESGRQPALPKDSSFVTQQIPMQYVKASDIANIARNLMPRGTDIVVYEPSNMLIVTAPPPGMIKFLKLMEAIDIPASERDSIKTFVYNVENGEAKKLAEILKNIYVSKKSEKGTPVKTVSPTPETAPPQQRAARAPQPPRPVSASVQEGLAAEIEGEILIEAYEDINALIIKTTPRGYLSLLETIKKLDVQPKQVLIDVVIAELSLTDQTKLGIEWLLKSKIRGFDNTQYPIVGGYSTGNIQYDTKNEVFGFPTVTNTVSSGTGTATQATDILLQPANVFATIIDPNHFGLVLSAAASEGTINVLASPHVLALDNKEAKIEIGDEVPVATQINTPGGTIVNTTSTVQFKSVGVLLTVTPHINEKKQVTLKISQEVSQVGDSVSIAGQSFTGFKTRRANTTAVVQDGHTLVLGGLISENKSYNRTGLPLLSKIPLLGYLFGTTTDQTDRKELILMVTPHVVGSHEEADALTKDMENRIKGIREALKDLRQSTRKKAEEAQKDAK